MSPRQRTVQPPERVEAQRRLIREALERRGLSVDELAARIHRKPVTVRLYLGDPHYKTRRDPSLDFLRRCERALRLQLVEPSTEDSPAPTRPAPHLQPDLRLRLLGFLTQAGVANSDQLMRLTDLNRSTFDRTMLLFLKEKLVVRFRQPPSSGLTRSQPYCYGLAPEGARLMAAHFGRPVKAAVARGQLKAQLILPHNLLVAEVALRLVLQLGALLADLTTDADARGATHVGLGKGVVLEPDLVALVTLDGLLRAHWYEIETGSQSRLDVERKVRAMEAFRHSPAFAERWGTLRLRTHWIGKDAEHAARLREWVGALRPSTMALFTSWDWIQRHDLDGPIWLPINGHGIQRVRLLDHRPPAGPDPSRTPDHERLPA